MELCSGARSLESFGKVRKNEERKKKEEERSGFISVCSHVD